MPEQVKAGSSCGLLEPGHKGAFQLLPVTPARIREIASQLHGTLIILKRALVIAGVELTLTGKAEADLERLADWLETNASLHPGSRRMQDEQSFETCHVPTKEY